jgi:NADH:ubiquinone oxidoreductase subunit 3 (subunit A)
MMMMMMMVVVVVVVVVMVMVVMMMMMIVKFMGITSFPKTKLKNHNSKQNYRYNSNSFFVTHFKQ